LKTRRLYYPGLILIFRPTGLLGERGTVQG
jgi:hypothetical protein